MTTRLEAVSQVLMSQGFYRIGSLPNRFAFSATTSSTSSTAASQSTVLTFGADPNSAYTVQAGDLLYVVSPVEYAGWYEITARTSTTVTLANFMCPASASNIVVNGVRRYDIEETGQAETMLDQVTREVLRRGWPQNTDHGRSITSGANAVIDARDAAFGANVLAVSGANPITANLYGLRNNSLYDNARFSNAFVNGTTVQVNLVRNYPWEQLQQDLKDLILKETKAQAGAMFGRNPQATQMYMSDAAKAEVTVGRNADPASINTRPIVLNAPAQN